MRHVLTLLLIFLLPIKFLVGTLSFYNLAWFSSFLLFIEVALLGAAFIYACIHFRSVHLNKLSKALIAFYLIYFAFVFFQVLVSPRIPRGYMMDVPEDNFTLFRDFVIQSLSLFLVLGFREHINFSLLAKVTVVLTFFTFFAYFNKVDFRVYGIIDMMEKQSVEDEQFITSFKLAWYMVFAFFCGCVVKNEWLKSGFINSILFCLYSIFFIIGVFITVKRGPILSFMAVCGLLLFLRYRNKLGMVVLLCGFCFFVFGENIMALLEDNVSGLVDRFSTISESGGAGRFGSDDSVFGTALKQIAEAPLFGSYFRLLKTTYTDAGAYPHNIILESLMTGGLFLTIPFIILLWKALKADFKLIEFGGVHALPALCFLYVLLSLMTSGSLLFKTEFWIFLAILCSYNLKTNKSQYE